jgi:group I intron endonuclease
MGWIYMIKNKINGKIYIGQTIRPIEKRLKEHKLGQSSKCKAIYSAIKKYGWGNFEIDWYECPDEDLNFDEDLLVCEIGTLSPCGYNLREGGGSRGKHNEESRQKMSEASIGKPKSKTHAKHISEARIGKTASDKTREKLSDAR